MDSLMKNQGKSRLRNLMYVLAKPNVEFSCKSPKAHSSSHNSISSRNCSKHCNKVHLLDKQLCRNAPSTSYWNKLTSMSQNRYTKGWRSTHSPRNLMHSQTRTFYRTACIFPLVPGGILHLQSQLTWAMDSERWSTHSLFMVAPSESSDPYQPSRIIFTDPRGIWHELFSN